MTTIEMMKICLLTPLLLATTALAQWDDVSAELVAGQVVVYEDTEDSLESLIIAMNEITDGGCSLFQEIPQLGVTTIQFPHDLSPPVAVELRTLFEDYVADGSLYWATPNLLADSGEGQTGSLWVSGIGIDFDGFVNQYAGPLLGLPAARPYSKGEGVLVSVIDTGVDSSHPVLMGQVSPLGINLVYSLQEPNDSSNGIDDDGDTLIDELWGHGTFIAGLIHLVAPKARILPVTVLNDDGVGDTSTIAAGIVYSADNGAHVISLALGTDVRSLVVAAAIDYAVGKGITIISPVGNDGGPESLYPAAEGNVHGVGGSDHLDTYGWYSNINEAIRYCAPGSSTLGGGNPVASQCIIGPRPGGNFYAAEGTSFATAFATGIAALVRAQHPEWPTVADPIGTLWYRVGAVIDASPFSVSIAAPVHTRPRADAAACVLAGPVVPPLGDLDGDGYVSGSDLGLLLAAWNAPLPTNGTLHLADLNIDFAVSGADLGLLLAEWNPAP